MIDTTLSIDIIGTDYSYLGDYNEFLDYTYTSSRYEEYCFLPHFIDGYIVVRGEKKIIKNLMNKKGEIMEIPYYHPNSLRNFRNGFSEGLVVFEKKGLFGMMDKNGNVAINPVFKILEKFREGRAYAECEKDGKTTKGFINRQGRFVIVQKESKF